MQKKLLLFILLVSIQIAKAQVTISVQLPPGGMVQKDQLWNLVVVSNNNTITDVVITLDIQDAMTGQTVLSAVSRNFSLGKGVKVISIKDAQPVQYNYIAAELSGSYIPLGSYIACYRVLNNDLKDRPLGDECVRVSINPISPPLLNTPADKSILENNYPQFTWLPPGPVDMFSSLNYEILVAEIMPGQSPAEAILFNTPVYSNHNLRMAFENYPTSFSKLKEGQLYAWQVVARNGLNYAAKTETWSFSIKPTDISTAPVISAGYIVLKSSQEPSGISTVNEEELLVKYYSFEKDGEYKIRFISPEGKTIREVDQKISYGDNFMRFRLTNEFRKETIYTIEIKDLQNNIYNGRFIIK